MRLKFPGQTQGCSRNLARKETAIRVPQLAALLLAMFASITLNATGMAQSLQFTAPAPGNALAAGEQNRVDWNASELAPDGVLEVWFSPFVDGSRGWEVIAEAPPGETGPIQPQFPDVAQERVGRLWIGNLTNPDGDGTEERYEVWDEIKIRISPDDPPSLRIRRPVDGETLEAGTKIEIEWGAANLEQRGSTELWFQTPDDEWRRIGEAPPLHEGTHTWTVPDVRGEGALWIGNLINPDAERTAVKYRVWDEIGIQIGGGGGVPVGGGRGINATCNVNPQRPNHNGTVTLTFSQPANAASIDRIDVTRWKVWIDGQRRPDIVGLNETETANKRKPVGVNGMRLGHVDRTAPNVVTYDPDKHDRDSGFTVAHRIAFALHNNPPNGPSQTLVCDPLNPGGLGIGERLSFIVNHPASSSDPENGDDEDGDGQGNCSEGPQRPEILQINGPNRIPGNDTWHDVGTTFRDPNCDLEAFRVTTILGPAAGATDEFDLDVQKPQGTFTWRVKCSNSGEESFLVQEQVVLIDETGRESDPVVYSYQCLPD